MKKFMITTWLVLAACMLVLLAPAGGMAKDCGPAAEETALKQACLNATVNAVQMEIDRHEKWLAYRKQQGDMQGAKEMEEALAGLRADLEKYRGMDARDYVLPEKIVCPSWVENKPADDTLLRIDMMSKSGPFYHLAGITGGDYAIIQPNTRYDMTFYKIYPRSYWNMSSHYVYVAEVGK